jgi:hypothetical protein
MNTIYYIYKKVGEVIMNYKGKHKNKSSKKAQRKLNEFLEIEEWNQFYEDRIFGGEIFDEVKHIEDDLFRNSKYGEI